MSFPPARPRPYCAVRHGLVLDGSGTVIATHDDLGIAGLHLRAFAGPAELGENYLEALDRPGANRDRAMAAVRKTLQGLTPRHTDQYLQIVDGKEHWTQRITLSLRGAARALVLYTDITDHQLVERARQESEARCRVMVDCSASPYARCDRALRVAELNEPFLRLVGVRLLRAVQGTLVTDWIATPQRDRFARHAAKVLAGGHQAAFKVTFQTPRHERKIVAVTMAKVSFRSEPFVAVFCGEQTRQRPPRLRLRERDARYQAIVEMQTELVCRFLPDTTLTFVNEACCRFFSKSRERLLHTRFLDLVPSEAKPCVREFIKRLLRAGTSPQICEYTARAPDGRVRWLQWTHVQIRRADGSVEFHGVGRDVTERKQAEDALRRSRSEVDELAGRLIRVHEEECRRIAREMHDGLSQQIAGHALGLSLLTRDFGSTDPALHERLQACEREARAIADGIRTFSHQMHPAIVDQVGLPAALARLAQQASHGAGTSFSADIQDPLPALPGEMAYSVYRIAQVILGNMARHAHASQFRICLAANRHQLELMIQDNGIGFQPKCIDASPALGLLSIKERVRYLRGHLAIETAAGHGTQLTIKLPLPSPKPLVLRGTAK